MTSGAKTLDVLRIRRKNMQHLITMGTGQVAHDVSRKHRALPEGKSPSPGGNREVELTWKKGENSTVTRTRLYREGPWWAEEKSVCWTMGSCRQPVEAESKN